MSVASGTEPGLSRRPADRRGRAGGPSGRIGSGFRGGLADSFLGLPFSPLTLDEAVAALEQASQGNTWHSVVTPNAAHLARLADGDETLLAIYQGAEFCFLDSRVIALAARLMRLRPPPVVTGSDLVARLFAEKIKPTTRLCIVGGDEATMARLRHRFGLRDVAHVDPSRGFWRNPAEMARLVDFVAASRADYTFLVVGSPQQEILAADIARDGRARGVGVCAGAAIDFLAGTQRRAPRLLQRLALEWAFRLCQDPRRLGHRYLVESPKAFWFVARGGLGPRR